MNKFSNYVLKVVQKIPEGKVMAYGHVAAAAGAPRAARMVGGVLRRLNPDSDIPWHRVINREGRISTYRIGTGELQRKLLEDEGVHFNREGKIDLQKYEWFPPEDIADVEDLNPDSLVHPRRRKKYHEKDS